MHKPKYCGVRNMQAYTARIHPNIVVYVAAYITHPKLCEKRASLHSLHKPKYCGVRDSLRTITTLVC